MKQEISNHQRTCSISGCERPTDVNIASRGVTRCSIHFSQDLDDYIHKQRIPRIAGRFQAQKAIMDTLEKPGLVQGEVESLKHFGKRCKEYTLRNQAGLLPKHLNGKSGTVPATN